MPTTPRCLFLSLTPPTVREQLLAQARQLGVVDLLGSTLFAPVNWHQSLSDRFEDDPQVIERLLSIGPGITAHAVRLRFDRIESTAGPDGNHWAFKPDQTPPDFDPLLQSVRTAIATVDNRKQAKPTAHVTLSYWASESLRRMKAIEPVDWLIDEVQLVRGHGDPYHYDVLGSWPLLPPRAVLAGEQRVLF